MTALLSIMVRYGLHQLWSLEGLTTIRLLLKYLHVSKTGGYLQFCSAMSQPRKTRKPLRPNLVAEDFQTEAAVHQFTKSPIVVEIDLILIEADD